MRNRMMAVLPLALAMATTACSHEGKGEQDGGKRTVDAGPATTQSYDLQGFTGVKVAGPDDVIIRQGEAFAIIAKGPKAIIDDLEIELDGDTLSVGRKKSGFSFSHRDGDGVRIEVTMPKLVAARLTGSGSIDADTIDGDAVEAIVTGSGDLKAAKLTGKSAKLSISGSGDIEIGGGTVASGDYSITGSGNIDAEKLAAQTINASIAGSGDIDAQATGKADINILGSGDANISGGANCTTRAMGSGTATCK